MIAVLSPERTSMGGASSGLRHPASHFSKERKRSRILKRSGDHT